MSESVDFLIVGGGLAGQVLQIQLAEKGYKTLVLDNAERNRSSVVAAGIINPLIGKFFTITWRADEVFDEMDAFYRQAENRLSTQFFRPKPLLRIFATAGEQNIWLSKAHQAKYKKYCNFENIEVAGFKADYGVLRIDRGGELDIKTFLAAARKMYPNEQTDFDYSLLDVVSKKYKDISFSHIVFCQGYQAMQNPFFRKDLIIPNKGELFEMECDGLEEEAICLGPVFIQPIGNKRFKVGSSYTPSEVSTEPTAFQLTDLQERLNKIIRVPYKVTNHFAGIRPTTGDRKPILGTHSDYPFMHYFNGLGSKGASLAPLMAREMVSYLVDGIPLPEDLNWSRFD